ncbi:hypothetical protein QE152_g9893 [Popillia japonica]|uniref:Uncharacterized protein n=1 Tax=Popillia japonica TaxID=7064 RepID=A0AAW1LWS1_POPJA
MSSSIGESLTSEKTEETVPDNASVVSDSGISEKAASVKSSASGIPKPTGIRPPSSTVGSSAGSTTTSRIGRLCTLGQPKPTLPQVTSSKSESLLFLKFLFKVHAF